VFRAFAALFFVGLLAVSAVWAVRFAQADAWSGQGTVEGLRQASRIVPDDAEYRLRLALSIADQAPAESLALLRQIAALSPADARIWVELGLRYESLQNYSEAEKCLLHAAEVDRQYVPRWTLANYYLRHEDTANFWRWARSCAEVIPGDPVPLFRLCGRVTEDGNLMDRLALHSAELRSTYLAYLIETGKLELGARVANGLVSEGSATAAPVLMDYCDRLLAGSRCRGGSVSLERPVAAWADSLRRLGSRWSPGPHKWRFLERADLPRVRLEDARRRRRITFARTCVWWPARDLLREQPENCSPLAQTVPVEGGGRYAVDVSYRTSGIQNDAGLSWQVVPLAPGSDASGVANRSGGKPDLESFPVRSTVRMPGGAIRARVPQKPWNDADRGLRRSQRSALAKNGLIIARRLRLSGDEAEKQEEEEKRQSEDQDFAQELFPPDTVASRSNLLLAGSLPCRILPGILAK